MMKLRYVTQHIHIFNIIQAKVLQQFIDHNPTFHGMGFHYVSFIFVQAGWLEQYIIRYTDLAYIMQRREHEDMFDISIIQFIFRCQLFSDDTTITRHPIKVTSCFWVSRMCDAACCLNSCFQRGYRWQLIDHHQGNHMAIYIYLA